MLGAYLCGGPGVDARVAHVLVLLPHHRLLLVVHLRHLSHVHLVLLVGCSVNTPQAPLLLAIKVLQPRLASIQSIVFNR